MKLAAVWAFCTPFYSEAGRAYHNLHHVEHMLVALKSRTDLLLPLELAVWGHDLIYDPARNDNEERSAQVFGEWLTVQGASPELRQEVAALILATRHDTPPQTPTAALIVDADLAVFGAADADFWAYEQSIRQEYAFVPWPAYRSGRQAILQHFLSQEQVYSTPEFAGLEAAARAHLEAAARKLADSPEE
ncbi:hypothetical protein GCM10022631_43120 [Deinococcus rubellus]|uniref:Phosphohydrolase n=1 Tax=Deinococcus rubellus TaxID=1889240 RepID=A0ABY5YN89_9DEIO|nr:phosphohydrolase [Deinococcus rubellus]UWX65213.1 phosphohydrolase [Deinococcus rubellus]